MFGPFAIFAAVWASVSVAAPTWVVRDSSGKTTDRMVESAQLFTPAVAGWADQRAVVTDLDAIADVAEATAAWIRTGEGCRALAGTGAPAALGLSADRTLQTLETIARIAREDQISAQSRLSDPNFLEATFDLWWWTPDREGARARGHELPRDQLRITRYLVTQLPGRAEPEGPYQYALYADPGPEARLLHTRREIIDGAWRAGGAKALVYLTERGVYDALMQGTVEVSIPGAGSRMFNVHEHNGHAYRPSVRDSKSQDRYWYFREVDGVYGFGAPESCTGAGKIRLAPKAAVAGDVYNIGLGRLILMQGEEGLHLAVLADTGGAFAPNLFQLDWFGGAFPSHKALYNATAMVPVTTRVGLLVVKSAEP